MTSDAAERLREANRQRETLRREWDATRNRGVLDLLVLTAPRLLNAERVGVFVKDTNADQLWLEAGTHVTERQIVVAAGASMVGDALRTGRPVVRYQLGGDTGAVGQVAYQVHDALTVPVWDASGTAAIGALQVLNRRNGQPWEQSDIELLQELAWVAAPTLQQVFSRQALLHDAVALDEQIRVLDRTESAIRGGRMLRTFEPAEPVPEGGFLHHRYHSRMYPPFIDAEATRWLTDSWDTDANDVFICTHQKVGTHLAKKFLVELVRQGGGLADPNPYTTGDIGHDTVPWPEVMFSQHGHGRWAEHLARTQGVPRIWYTHCHYHDFPAQRLHPRSRFLVVVRDPRAVAVSQYFFWKRHPLLKVPADLDLDQFVTRFVDGDLYFGDYHEHVLSWIQRSDERISPQNILFVRYEDLVERKQEMLPELCEFLFPGRTLSPDVKQAIVAATDFEAMKSELTENPQSFHLDPKVYFRAGRTDDWRQHLSDLAIESIDAKTRAVWGGDLECPPWHGARVAGNQAT
jgi:hypothetical protein